MLQNFTGKLNYLIELWFVFLHIDNFTRHIQHILVPTNIEMIFTDGTMVCDTHAVSRLLYHLKIIHC
jgi:hypothetical protein